MKDFMEQTRSRSLESLSVLERDQPLLDEAFAKVLNLQYQVIEMLFLNP